MRSWRFFGLIGVILLAGLAFAALSLIRSEAFWRWSGQYLLQVAEKHLQGTISVGDLRGSPLTGLTCTQLVFQRPEGEVFRADSLRLRLSLWSLLKLQPVVADLTLEHPILTLYRDFPTSTAPPSQPPASVPQTSGPPFRSLTFSQIVLYQGEVILKAPGAIQRWSGFHLTANLTILHPGQPQQSILARQLALTMDTHKGLFSLTGRLSYSHQQLNLASLTLLREEQPLLSFGGLVDFGQAGPDLRLTGEFSPLPAQVLQIFWPSWPANLPLAGQFAFRGHPAHLHLKAQGPLETGAYDLTLELRRPERTWQYELNLNLSALPSGLLNSLRPAPLPPLPLGSPLTAQLHLLGTDLKWPPVNFTATLKCQPFTWGASKLEHVNLTFTAAQGRQSFHGSLQARGGTLTVLAHGPLWPALQGDLKIQAASFSPALLGLAVPSGTLLTGTFTGSFRVPDSRHPHRLWLAGQVQAAGRLGQQPLHELRARLTWDQARLAFPEARLRLGGWAADLKGHLEGENLEVEARLRSTTPGGWPLPPSFQGHLEAQVRLSGSLAHPRYAFRAKGHKLSWRQINLASATVELSGAGWPPKEGSLTLQGEGFRTPLGLFAQAGLSCQGQAGRWQINLQATAPEKGEEAALQGVADLTSRPLYLQFSHCRLRRGPLTLQNTVPLSLRFLPGLTIAPVAFSLNGGRLKFQADIDAHKFTGSCDLQDLPAELFAVKGEPLSGKINAHLTLSGSGTQPLFQGYLAWRQGRWRQVHLGDVTSQVSYHPDWLQFSGTLSESTAGARLTWEGRLPVRFSLIPWRLLWGEEDMRLAVRGDHINLSLLTLLSREVQAAQGEVSLAAQWQGKVSHPHLSGHVRWGPGSITIRQGGLPYRLLPGEFTLAGHTLTLPQLTLESRGTATIHGTVTLAGFLPQQLDLKASLDHFQAIRRGGSEALGSGSLTFTGSWGAPLLQGHLLVTQATFQTAFFQTPGHDDIILVSRQTAAQNQSQKPHDFQVLPQVKMAIVLETPGGVFVKNKLLNVELAGRLTAYKNPGQPAYLAGDLRALQGTVNLHGKPFKVLEGALHFPGRPRAPVLLEGRCAYELADLTLFLHATGAAKKPEIKLTSTPPLSPGDLLSYLIFGQPAQALNREQYLTVGQQVAKILGGLTAKKIQDLLGPDFPLVGDLSLVARQDTMGIAKPLSKDLTISLERKTNPVYRDDLNQLRLEYRLNRYLSIESQLGRRNSGADLLLNLDF